MLNANVFEEIQSVSYLEVTAKLEIGDLLFCSGTSPISEAIKTATHSIFSHVGLILQLPVTQQWLVLESVESIGVRCVALEEGYVTNYMGGGHGYPGKILVARHAEMKSKAQCFSQLYQRAFSLLGDQYNKQDIFAISARICMGKVGINQQGNLLGHDGYICSEYVYACFNALGINLAFDKLGFIAPADIANLPEVSPVLQLQLNP